MKIWSIFAAILLLTACAGNEIGGVQIPPEVTAPCSGKVAGDACKFGREGGSTLSGQCQVFEGVLACHADPLPTIGESSQLLTACHNKAIGDPCVFNTDGGNDVKGNCQLNKQGNIMCAKYDLRN